MKRRHIIAAAEAIWRLRERGARANELPDALTPDNLDDAWYIQRALDDLAGTRIGWKVASSSPESQRSLGISGPLVGALYQSQLVDDGATLATTTMQLAEAEFAIRMIVELGPSNRRYTRDDVVSAVGEILPAIEVPECRVGTFPEIAAPQLVADFMAGGHVILGLPLGSNPSSLAKTKVELRRNGDIEAVGSGADVFGDPLNSIVWLANELIARGERLRAGDLILSGACAFVGYVAPDDKIVAAFAGIDRVAVTFSRRRTTTNRGTLGSRHHGPVTFGSE